MGVVRALNYGYTDMECKNKTTLPIWTTFSNIKKESVSTLEISLNDHFSFDNSTLDVQVVIVVRLSFCLPRFIDILIEGGRGEVYDNIIIVICSTDL